MNNKRSKNKRLNTISNIIEDNKVAFSRRKFVHNIGVTGLFLSFSDLMSNRLLASNIFDKKKILKLKMPNESYKKNKTNDGIIGPFGEARFIKDMENKAYPVNIITRDDLAQLDISSGKMNIRIGKKSDQNVVYFVSKGIIIGKEKEIPYSETNVMKAMSIIKNDKQKIEGALLIRSTLLTSFPAALKIYKFNNSGKNNSSPFTKYYKKSIKSMGQNGLTCTTESKKVRTYVEKIYGEVTRLVQTAQEAYVQCLTSPKNIRECKSSLFPRTCLQAICIASTFADVFVTATEIVDEIIHEVWEDVTTCASKPLDFIPNPWQVVAERLRSEYNGFLNPPVTRIEPNVQSGKNELINIFEGISTISRLKCVLDGNWSLLPINNLVQVSGIGHIPYGVKVCVDGNCARFLRDSPEELSKAFLPAFAVFAALTKDATIIGAVNALAGSIAAVPAQASAAAAVPAIITTVTAAIATIPPAAIAAMVIIMALIILIIYYSVSVGVQLNYFIENEDFSDNLICIEHPSVAIVTVMLATGGLVPAFIYPPIVKG